MTRSKGAGPSRRRGLSSEDEALWDVASQNYEPLKRGKPRVRGQVVEEDDHRSAGPARLAPSRYVPHGHPSPRAPALSAPQRPKPAPHPPVHAAVSPPLAEFDRRKARKIAAGRETIDARIDLHGMRQSEAHLALRSFLLSCFGDGRRNVLVITGKGGPAREADESGPSFMDTRERGVLKRNVPMWLVEPELRAIVVSYRHAAQPHGGGGALYVHLRARHKVGGRD